MLTFDSWMNGQNSEPLDVPRESAMIVIDMQHGFITPEHSIGLAPTTAPFAMAVPGCVKLLESARAAGRPVIFTRATHVHNFADVPPPRGRKRPWAKVLHEDSKQAEIVDELAPLSTEYVIDKSYPGAMYGTRLEPLLTGLGVRSLVLCGVTTNICVEATAREAHARGYDVYVVADATGEAEVSRYWHALFTIDWGFGSVVDVADVQRSWGTKVTGVPGFPLRRQRLSRDEEVAG